MFDEVEAQQNNILALIRQIEPQFEHGAMPESLMIGGLRRGFSVQLKHHIAHMQMSVFPVVRSRGNAGERAVVDRMTASRTQLADAYARHIDRFKTDADTIVTPEYRASVTLLLRITRRLIDHERRDLYPILKAMPQR